MNYRVSQQDLDRDLAKKNLKNIVWKLLKSRMWIFEFGIFPNFFRLKIDLSLNTVWPQALGFQKLAKLATFSAF